MRGIRHRLRQEAGFGLVELVIAMTVLVVGLLALVAAYSSGYAAVDRASTLGTATLLADKQMELYRAETWSQISLNATLLAAADSTYTGDSSYPTTSVTGCTTSDPACTPTQTVTGPDGRTYRIDTYITTQTPTDGRAVDLVTVVVRDSGGRVWTREQSTFDQLTGLAGS